MIFRITENDIKSMVLETSRRLLREFDWEDEWKEFNNSHQDAYDGQLPFRPSKKSGKKSSGKKNHKNKGDKSKETQDNILQRNTVAGTVRNAVEAFGGVLDPKKTGIPGAQPAQQAMPAAAPMPGQVPAAPMPMPQMPMAAPMPQMAPPPPAAAPTA